MLKVKVRSEIKEFNIQFASSNEVFNIIFLKFSIEKVEAFDCTARETQSSTGNEANLSYFTIHQIFETLV